MKRSALVSLSILLALGFFLVCSQGCATIVKGKTQEVSFKSEPEGATIIINGRELGKTPLTTQLERKTEQALTFTKEGYKTHVMPLTTTTTGWFWGNLGFLTYGLFSSTTDGVSGAINEYSPSYYFVTLVPLAGATPQDLQRNEAKNFIVSNYKSILEEINFEPGQYVSSLQKILNIPPEQKEAFVKEVKTLAEQKKDIVDFADTVSKKYIK